MLNEFMQDNWRLRLRRAIHDWKSKAPPGVVTHDLVDEANDPVLNQLRACRLFNLPPVALEQTHRPN